MKKVILTRGLPGSGKSTWAKKMIDENPNQYKRINKDDLRAMLDNSKWSEDSEKFILQLRDLIILQALEKGKNVIVDDTNLANKHIERIKLLVKGIAEVVIQDFTNINVDECIKRDLKRCESVGEKRIREMYNQHLRSKGNYIEDKNLPRAIIVDIDGTLAKMNGRSPFDWSRVKEDHVNEAIKDIVNSYENTVIIFSGRDGVCKTDTECWLSENAIYYDSIFMRPEGNNEKDAIIKRRMFDENIKGKYFVEYVLDDRDQVVEMWRSMGLTCLQVDYGNF